MTAGKITRYLLVGSGAASIAALEAIHGRDSSAEVTMLTDDPFGYYTRPGLAYYLSGEIPEDMLFPFRKEDFQRLNVRRIQAQVVLIHPDEHLVELQNRTRLPYDRLLVATGAQATRASVPGADLPEVVKLDSLEDVRQIIKIARKARTAVVIGGGITALELVEGLLRRKVKVHYFLRGDRYWGNVLDEKESRIVEKRLAHHGVQIHFNTEMEEIVGARNHVKGVRTKTGKVIACDMVAIAIGIRPRKELAEKSGLNVDRGILVNEYLQTSSPDIFAAGDVAQVYDPFLGKSVLDSLWGPARDQGKTAGLNMTGERLAYHKVIPFNVTRLADLTTTIIGKVGGGDDHDLLGSAQDIPGIARGDSETWRQLPDAIAAQADFEVNRLRILIEDNQLIGAIVMGDQTLSHALQHIILEKMDISVIRENLIRPGAHIADSIARYWKEQQPV